MIAGARYAHTNLVARDWRALADFYVRLFGCEFVPPERDDAGPALEAGTGVPGAAMAGVHLRLPGHGPGGPTLEIFTYTAAVDAMAAVVNRPGYGHIAFEVASVADARRTRTSPASTAQEPCCRPSPAATSSRRSWSWRSSNWRSRRTGLPLMPSWRRSSKAKGGTGERPEGG
ncbi:MAG TPA: VOC family protein [Trueperaceae bacterium]|nr:VOC family protein [Trueperaceae bacterium]